MFYSLINSKLAMDQVNPHLQQPKSPTFSTSSAVFAAAARLFGISIEDDDDDPMIDITDETNEQHNEYSLGICVC